MPFPDFGVAVSKRETTSPIMIRGRDVLPVVQCRVINEVGVINRVRLLIEHQPGLGGSGHVTLLKELAVFQPPVLAAHSRISSRSALVPAKKRIHRQTAI